MDNISTLISRLKPDIIGIIEELGLLTTTTSSSGTITTVLTTSQYPDALLRDGSRSLLNSLAVATGATIDGVDLDVLQSDVDSHVGDDAVSAHGSVGAHTHTDAPSGGILDHGALSGLSDDDHSQYAAANGSGLTRSAYQAERLTKQLIAGAGLTGGGVLDADRTVDVGAGVGITVNANDVAVNTGAAFGWTGAHTFSGPFNVQVDAIVRSLIPELTDTYNLGSTLKWWNKGFISEIDAVVFAEQTAQLLGGYLIIPPDAGTIAADVGTGDATVNFGKAMTPGHFVVFRAIGQVEYMQVGSLVSGTIYNVTRNLDGSGANAWVAGTPFCVNGTTGNGRIEHNAYDTPRIQLIKQGATYNAQTEMIRLGDLNGNWGYSSETYGLAVGEYAASKPNLTIDSTNGLRIRNHNSDVLVLDTSGNANITGLLKAGSYTKIDNTGVYIDSALGAETAAAAFRHVDGANTRSIWFSTSDASNTRTDIVAKAIASKHQTFNVAAIGNSGFSNNVAFFAQTGLGIFAGLSAGIDASGNTAVSLLGNRVSYNTGATLNIGDTSFPSSPTADDVYYRTDFRAWFVYDGSGSAWKQISVGSFASSFPSSPVDNLRVYREDRDLLYFYNTATSQWLTVQEFEAIAAEIQQLAPYTTTNISTSDTVVINYTIDTRSYQALITAFTSRFVLTTNNGSNYWTYTFEYSPLGGTAATIGTANTSASAADTHLSPTIHTYTTTTLGTNGAIVRFLLKRNGSPGTFFARPVIKYRLIG